MLPRTPDTAFGHRNNEVSTPPGRRRSSTLPENALASRAGERCFKTSPTGAERFDEAYEVLSHLAATLPNDRHLIHDDLLYRNVLVDGRRINAVIDWGNSMYGDHLYEAALLLYWWPWYPQWSGIDIRAELDRHGAEHCGSAAGRP
jgi:aminoglycoside phosphotransferase (APT) family kinase protein